MNPNRPYKAMLNKPFSQTCVILEIHFYMVMFYVLHSSVLFYSHVHQFSPKSNITSFDHLFKKSLKALRPMKFIYYESIFHIHKSYVMNLYNFLKIDGQKYKYLTQDECR